MSCWNCNARHGFFHLKQCIEGYFNMQPIDLQPYALTTKLPPLPDITITRLDGRRSGCHENPDPGPPHLQVEVELSQEQHVAVKALLGLLVPLHCDIPLLVLCTTPAEGTRYADEEAVRQNGQLEVCSQNVKCFDDHMRSICNTSTLFQTNLLRRSCRKLPLVGLIVIL